MNKALTWFIVLTSSCFGQELWNGARYGMSMPEFEKLFGGHLKLGFSNAEQRNYMLDTPENLCGGDFEVEVTFVAGTGLQVVSLITRVGNLGEIGSCVLNLLTKRLGHPKSRRLDGKYAEYQFYRLFSRRFTTLWIQPKLVQIGYTCGRPGNFFNHGIE